MVLISAVGRDKGLIGQTAVVRRAVLFVGTPSGLAARTTEVSVTCRALVLAGCLTVKVTTQLLPAASTAAGALQVMVPVAPRATPPQLSPAGAVTLLASICVGSSALVSRIPCAPAWPRFFTVTW